MSVNEYESWLETLEIMSDKKALKNIRKAEKELAQGKYYTFEQVFKKTKQERDSEASGLWTETGIQRKSVLLHLKTPPCILDFLLLKD